MRDSLAAILVSTEGALECNGSRQNTALLRLAYCKTEGLRRWSQHELFQERFREELTASQVPPTGDAFFLGFGEDFIVVIERVSRST